MQSIQLDLGPSRNVPVQGERDVSCTARAGQSQVPGGRIFVFPVCRPQEEKRRAARLISSGPPAVLEASTSGPGTRKAIGPAGNLLPSAKAEPRPAGLSQ